MTGYALDPCMAGPARYERIEHDFYETPAWCTEALLQHWRPRGLVWEPAAGNCAIADVLADRGCRVMCSDIVRRDRDVSVCDFLEVGSPGDALFSIVTNPPYELAEAFIRRSLELTRRPGGDVAMLMRHEFDCAAGRRELFEREPFATKIVLTKRPRWFARRPGDASPRHNYAWFVWSWNHAGPARLRYAP